MNSNSKNQLLKIVKKILRVITFPVFIIFFPIIKFVQKSKFSIRLSLSLMYLKIVMRTLILTGLLIICGYGAYKIYFVYENYNLITQHIIENQKIEPQSLKNVLDAKHNVAVYDENKNLLFSSDSKPYQHRDIFYLAKSNGNFFIVLS